MMNGKKDSLLMTEGPILKKIILFSIPLLIGNLFQQLYNTVDSLIVGNYVSAQALAAVGSTGPIVNTLIGLFSGLSTGGTVVISQYFGAKNREKLQEAVHTTVMMVVILSIVFTFLGRWIAPTMLRFMKTPEDVFPLSSTYFSIYFSGISGLMLYNIGAGILRAVGDSRRPLYFLLLSSVLNIILDLVFVLKFDMGIAGVAYATIISQYISAALILLVLMRTHGEYRLYLKKLWLHLPILKRIVSIGLPTALQMAVTAFSNIFVQSYINVFGSSAMAGWSAFNKVDQFVMLPMQSISIAATTFIGQNFGAKRMDRVKRGTIIAVTLSVGVTAALTALVIVFARPLIAMFNPADAVVYYGTLTMYYMGTFMVINCVGQTLAGCLRGMGHSRGSMFIFLGCYVAFRQVYLFTASRLTDSFIAVAFAYPAGWILCTVIMIFYYRWRTAKMFQNAGLSQS